MSNWSVASIHRSGNKWWFFQITSLNYCYIPYVSFKAMVAYMKCKRFQIQRRLFLLQTSELSDWYFCVLGIVCRNRWKWQLRISWCPCSPKNQFRHGTNNFKKCLMILFTLNKISFNIPVYQSIPVKYT